MKILNKKNILTKALLCSFSAIALVALTLGCVFGFNNNAPKVEPANSDTQSATQPKDTSKAWSDTGTYITNWDGNGTESSPYLIDSAQKLAGIVYLVNSDTAPVTLNDHSEKFYFVDTYFKQTCDINLEQYWWKSISSFAGSYDGGGFSISGMISATNSGGLFTKLYGYYKTYMQSAQDKTAVVKNVRIVNSSINTCAVASNTQRATISNCEVFATINGNAGLVQNAGSVTIINGCKNLGNVIGGSTGYVGGIISQSNGGGAYTGEITISNCYNSGNIKGQYAGGIFAYNGKTINISQCYNAGDIEATGSYAGGIAGLANYQIKNCYNTGSITASSGDAGGIIGTGYTSVYNCFNTGTITGKVAGGIVGTLDYMNKVSAVNCFNVGGVGGTTSAGGIAGKVGSNGTVTKCYYGGDCVLNVGAGSGTDTATKNSSLNSTSYAKGMSWYTTVSNWDSAYPWNFGFTWTFKSDENDGYPVLVKGNERPTNDKYWDEAHDAGLVTLDFDWEGDGSEGNPWKISSAEELAGLSYTIYKNTASASNIASTNYYYEDKYFKQTADIDVSNYWWQPIGIGCNRSGTTTSRYFSGNYDGDSHTVSGVFTKSGSESKNSYQGLFGYIQARHNILKTSISNLGVINSYIQGAYNVGGIIGYSDYSIIINNCYNTSIVRGVGCIGGISGYVCRKTDIVNCHNSGSIIGSGDMIGGLVGYAESNINIIRCYNNGEINGRAIVGGISGYIGAAYLNNCYNTGSIKSSDSQTGGIVGHGEGRGKYINNCYNKGVINGGSTYVGGIAGRVSNPAITNCYNVGVADSAYLAIGGIAGESYYNSNCYYGGECTLTTGVGYGTDTTTKIENLNTKDYAKGRAWYTNSDNWDSTYPWDFKNVWRFKDGVNDGYPVFLWEYPITNWIEIPDTSYETLNAGTAADPYEIDTAEKLAGISYQVKNGTNYSGKAFKQTADISLKGYDWYPIGYGGSETGMGTQFMANYDGNNHTISNMYVKLDRDYVGLFGAVGKPLKNIRIKNSTVFGGNYTGALCGLTDGAENCKVENCYVSGKDYTGGVAGLFYYSMTSCSFEGEVHAYAEEDLGYMTNYGYQYVGGIAGAGTQFNLCSVKGIVEGYQLVGGIVGSPTNNREIYMTDCFVEATINAEIFSGGLVGQLTDFTTIDNSFVKAKFILKSGNNSGFNGGLIGYINPPDIYVNINNCAVVATSNYDIEKFHSMTMNTNLTLNSCYAKFNKGNGVYTAGDFAAYGLVDGQNGDLPMQKDLFYMASKSTATGAQVLQRLKDKGFELYV